MFSLLIALAFSAYIGYLAQATGICMVRGVADWMKGRRVRLLAILGTGFWVSLYFSLMASGDTPVYMQRHDMHWGFLLGGLIFGFGTAMNGACSISTASRLSSGDLRMIFTMMGWLIGWLLLDYAGVDFGYTRSGVAAAWLPAISWAIPGMLVLANIYVYLRHRQVWRLWSGIMLVGILAGALFLLQPVWSPSDFVRDLGLAIIARDADMLPVVERIVILTVMLLGMGISSWRYKRFRIVVPGLRDAGMHLAAGTLMGAGSAAALGGNDFQLLIALPALSLAGFLAIAGIVLGTRIGIAVIGSKAPAAMR